MRSIDIAVGRPYRVHIGHGLLAQAGELTRDVHRPCALALVMDKTVADHYGDTVARSFADAGFQVAAYRFPPGEASKSMERLSDLLEFFARQGLGRGDLVAALGGGVAGDLAGFAAATYQRGTAYVQLPTTLLAAVDSSVGGKTAVNLHAGKNLAGAFWQPSQVVCDCDTFKTLPREELASGAAECVKYAVLDDPALLHRLTLDGLDAPWQEIVPPCVRQKARIVAEDELDLGQRQLLNFGHTIGHAAERLSGYALRHGEAVAMGMLVITRAAERMGVCTEGTATEIARALQSLGLPTRCPYPPGEVARAALGDKKRRGDEITLVIPRAIGDCVLRGIKTAELERWVRLGMEE